MPAFQLVLQFRGTSIEDLDELLEIEAALFEILEHPEEVAGHDIGDGARSIFIVTDDPDATFRHLTPFLQRARLLVSLVVAARAANEGRYRVLWPADHQGEFSLA